VPLINPVDNAFTVKVMLRVATQRRDLVGAQELIETYRAFLDMIELVGCKLFLGQTVHHLLNALPLQLTGVSLLPLRDEQYGDQYDEHQIHSHLKVADDQQYEHQLVHTL
jgi:hypothetical protein